MKKRIISTAFILIALYLSINFGGIYAVLAWILAASTLTLFELNKFLSRAGLSTMPTVSALLALLYHVLILCRSVLFVEFFVLSIFLLCFIGITKNVADRANAMMTGIFGFVLVPFAFGFMILSVMQISELHSPTVAITTILWIVLTTKFTDIGGLLIGSVFGKRKLAPSISPLKTWEGVIGGIFVSLAFSALFFVTFSKNLPGKLTILSALLIAFAVSISSIISDLAESVLKRAAGIKDSGNLIPGIGGIFDLTDSFILSSPIAYCLLKNFII